MINSTSSGWYLSFLFFPISWNKLQCHLTREPHCYGVGNIPCGMNSQINSLMRGMKMSLGQQRHMIGSGAFVSESKKYIHEDTTVLSQSTSYCTSNRRPILQDVNGYGFLYMQFHEQISMVDVTLKQVEKTALLLKVSQSATWSDEKFSPRGRHIIYIYIYIYIYIKLKYMIMEPFTPGSFHKVTAFHEALFGNHFPKTFSAQVHLAQLNENLFFPEPQFGISDQLFFTSFSHGLNVPCQSVPEEEEEEGEGGKGGGRRRKWKSKLLQALKSKLSHTKIIAWNTFQQQAKRQKTELYLKIKLHPYHLFSNQYAITLSTEVVCK